MAEWLRWAWVDIIAHDRRQGAYVSFVVVACYRMEPYYLPTSYAE